MLTKKDIQHIRRQMGGEYLSYLSHAAMGKLRPNELAHLEYLKGLHDRLDAAETAAPDAVEAIAA